MSAETTAKTVIKAQVTLPLGVEVITDESKLAEAAGGLIGELARDLLRPDPFTTQVTKRVKSSKPIALTLEVPAGEVGSAVVALRELAAALEGHAR